jgi:hypothetical protein
MRAVQPRRRPLLVHLFPAKLFHVAHGDVECRHIGQMGIPSDAKRRQERQKALHRIFPVSKTICRKRVSSFRRAALIAWW